MTAQTGVQASSADRKILVAAVTIVVMALVMAATQVVAYLQSGSDRPAIAFWIELAAAAVTLLTAVTAGPLALREMKERHRMAQAATESRRQVERLFQMTDMLQSAMDHADANAVLRATAEQLLSDFGGALYVFNNSRDRLDLSTSWDWAGEHAPPETVAPSQCWALKRGKLHVNRTGLGALRCEHQKSDASILEIPMMARGEVLGLLNVQAIGADAEERLAAIAPLAGAISDAMSLALSNIALREKLKTQALRDPLTGLYNRRYMEDVLERYGNLAERNGSAMSVIMIDLDHFKRLNDELGHAVGDAVLREAAAAIVGGLRQSDVACRYGGEELVVLLPECPLAEAAIKAEGMRKRVEALSEIHGARVTASFGVATIPETSTDIREILAMSDAALYRAKQDGRNRVAIAQRRQVNPAAERSAA